MYDPIAIVGMACRFPADVQSPEDLWTFTMTGEDAIAACPAGRSAWLGLERSAASGALPSASGGFLRDIAGFDAGFFGISPREARAMDPQHRILLETCWHAFEDANLTASALNGSRAALFAALGSDDYVKAFFRANSDADLDQYFAVGNAPSAALGRLAQALNLRGPAIAVDTACSSSATCIHLAARALQCGDAEIALAGGVNLILDRAPSIALAKAGMLSPTGRCHTFDAAADGYVRSEGCGMLVLKRLDRALADLDRIHAVLVGSAINHDGRSASLTTPRGPAQTEVIRAALASAGLESGDVGYVETHGTGTPLGDPIEVAGLQAVYGGPDATVAVASLKSALGHCESAAGVASAIRAVMALRHGRLPVQAHFDRLNPRVELGRLRIADGEKTSPTRGPRRVAVSSFGFSGTNVHMILEAAPAADRSAMPPQHHSPIPIFVASAKSRAALQALLADHADRLSELPESDLGPYLEASARSRTPWRHRFAAPAPSLPSLRQRTEEAASGADTDLLGTSSEPPTVAFMFSGQGEQCERMGEDLHSTDRHFRAAFEACEAVLLERTGLRLSEILYGEQSSLARDPLWIQLSLFSIQYSLAQAWIARGVKPAVVTGHSLGEYAAAVVAGAYALEDALELVLARAEAMSVLPATSGMISVMASREPVEALIADLADVAIAVENGAEQVAVSGADTGLAIAAQRLTEAGLTHRRIAKVRGFHSPLLDDALPRLKSNLAGIPARVPTIPWISSATAELVSYDDLGPEFWARQVRGPVLFSKSLGGLVAAGASVLLEIGPSTVLSGLARRSAEVRDSCVAVIASAGAGGQMRDAFSGALAKLYLLGAGIDWSAHFSQGALPDLPLPSYPFQRSPYWFGATSEPRVQPQAADVPLTTADPMQSYYRFVSERHNGRDEEGAFIRFAPFAKVIDGFSWLRVHSDPAAHPRFFAIAEDAREDMWRRLFGGLPLGSGGRIADVGCGFGADVIRLAKERAADFVTGFNISSEQVSFAKARAARLEVSNADFCRLDISQEPLPSNHDGAIAIQVFHHIRDKRSALRNLAAGLRPHGWLMFAEIFSQLDEAIEDEPSTAFFETLQRWPELLAAARFRIVDVQDLSAEIANYLFDPDFESTLDEVAGGFPAEVRAHLKGPHQLGELLRRKLAVYLICRAEFVPECDEETLVSQNAHRLAEAVRAQDIAERLTPAEAVKEIIASAAGMALDDLDEDLDLADLGVDSLMALEIKQQLEARLQVAVGIAELFEQSSIRALGELAAARAGSAVGPVPSWSGSDEDPFAPFPLNEIQQAYWIGRDPDLDLGGVAAHFYAEFERADWDIDRLEAAWNAVVARHPMLRAVVLDERQQRVLPSVPPFQIRRHAIAGFAADKAEEAIFAIRERLSHEVRELTQWPPFAIEAAELGQGRTRIFFSIDIIFVDALSAFQIAREWRAFYENPHPRMAPIELTFRQCALRQAGAAETEAQNSSLEYWRDRIPVLPPAPDLPARSRDLDSADSSRFTRLAGELDAVRWGGLCKAGRERRVTPSCALLTAYAAVLARWSSSPAFTLATTLYNRPAGGPGIHSVVGDFTAIDLLAIRYDGTESFAANATRIQAQLMADLDHGEVSGVRLLRELSRARGATRTAQFPIVFTSALNERAGADEAETWLPDMVHGVTQTPQVLLDHAAYTCGGRLLYHWDHVISAFPSGVAEAMFEAYTQALERLSDQGAWDEPLLPQLPSDHDSRRKEYNSTVYPDAPALMQAGVIRCAAADPDRPAVLTASRSLSYGELAALGMSVAERIAAAAPPTGVPVAIILETGWRQAAALVGATISGHPYLPLDPSAPSDRSRRILRDAGVGAILCDAATAERWRGIGIPCLSLETLTASTTPPEVGAATISDVAYVIYTSGSTGDPKGVAIAHAAASNTIEDVNRRFGVTSDDRVLGLSALTFDLSVYDFFGIWAAGGAVVIPEGEARRDPRAWRQLIREHWITVWNTVPALMGILLEGGPEDDRTQPSLRLVLLSGDWVPLGLPAFVKTAFPGSRVVALGGATEAGIWSVFHEVDDVDPQWRSIPYGRPLGNQGLDVISADGTSCPEHVTGQIVITGKSLAAGYWKDPDLTDAKFVRDPATGSTLYATGDLGRFVPEGHIEFLGRMDDQVKLRGHRIELGEIEALAGRHPAVRQAAAAIRKDPNGYDRLVLYVVTDLSDPENWLVSELRRQLPAYSVPSRCIGVESLPLSSNGKVDRKSLPSPDWTWSTASGADDRVSGALAAIWSELLGRQPAPEDDFFECGGDSLLAVRFVRRLEESHGVRLKLDGIYGGSSFVEICQAVQGAWSPWVPAFGQHVPEAEPERRQSASPLRTQRRAAPGHLDAERLARAVGALISRHPILDHLTMEFGTDGPARAGAATDEPPGNRAMGSAASIGLEAAGGGDHIIVFSVPADRFDDFSLDLAFDDLEILYNADAGIADAGLPSTTGSGSAYQAWHSDWLERGGRTRELDYWRRRLASGAQPIGVRFRSTEDPSNAERRLAGEEFEAAELTLRQGWRELTAFARAHRASPASVLSSAVAITLSRLTGAQRVRIGVLDAMRQHPAAQGVMGALSNSVMLDVDTATATTAANLVKRVGVDLRKGLEHGYTRLAEVHSELCDPTAPPFRVAVEWLEPVSGSWRRTGLPVGPAVAETLVVGSTTSEDLCLTVSSDNRATGVGAAARFLAALEETLGRVLSAAHVPLSSIAPNAELQDA